MRHSQGGIGIGVAPSPSPAFPLLRAARPHAHHGFSERDFVTRLGIGGCAWRGRAQRAVLPNGRRPNPQTLFAAPVRIFSWESAYCSGRVVLSHSRRCVYEAALRVWAPSAHGGGIVATETAWAHASSQDDMQKWQTVCDQYVAGVHVSILVCCMPRGRG